MQEEPDPRLGLNVPYEWWPAATMLKEMEAAGFRWTQLPAPAASVLADTRQLFIHARAVRDALETTSLRSVIHGPGALRAGEPAADRIFEGLLAYASEVGAEQIVYHALAHPNEFAAEDLVLSETRSLARLAQRAERLGVRIAIENLAPVFPGVELVSFTPAALRTTVKRISSSHLGLCLDVGHANVVASLRRTDPLELIEPALDTTILFHVHDNLGARRGGERPPELDPLRLDLHLPPGRGTLPWAELAPYLQINDSPRLLEIHPPSRPTPAKLYEEWHAALRGKATRA